MIYDPFQFFCYYYTEVVKHDPLAPLPGADDMLSSEVQHLKKKKDNTHSKV